MTGAEDTAVPMAPADKHHAALPMSLPRTQSFSEIKYTPVIFGISSKNLHHEKYKTRQEAMLAGAGGENIGLCPQTLPVSSCPPQR